jgi:flagellar basal-body rod modification protein FlgD
MAAGMTGVWNQMPNRAAAVRDVTNVASAGQSGSSSGTSATIAANDFLTLLVTEMKNQDPTATTDPNEYVNQLVQVNSLQQLISINETLQNSASTAPKTDLASRTAASQSAGGHGANAAAQSVAAGKMDSRAQSSAAHQIATALTR